MYFSDDIIEEVRSRSDIVDVISSYVKLQKKGASYFGLCPFHNEKSPSFSVSGSKQMFYCFGCGEGGNVFSFLMKYESMTFGEALKSLADRAGVALPEASLNPEEKRRADLKSSVLEINREAALYYHRLLSAEDGNAARAYFAKRELENRTVTAFGLGVSGMRSDSLYRYLKNKGFQDFLLKETGLFIYDERGVRDRFRNRVMFPILNTGNKVIGFGGRVMGDGQPKYLNSPETAVFDKGRNLYGLNAAKNSRKGNMIICEGYMDVISMHQAGFNQAVASLGTALTAGQAMLIKRYVKDVLICYDSDGAGVKAALRAIGIFREAGLRTKVINMQPHKDADEFIKAEGEEAFRERIDNAENSFLFEVRMSEREFDLNDPDGKTAFLNAAAQRLSQFSEEIERSNYIDAVAAKYFVSPDSLKKLVARYAASGQTRRAEPKEPKHVDKIRDDGIRKSQRMLLTWICDSPSVYPPVRKYIAPEDFTEPIYQRVARIMFEQLEENRFNPAAIMNNFEDGDEQREVAAVLNTNVLDGSAKSEEREKALNEAVLIIKKHSLDERSRNAAGLEELQQIIAEQAQLKNLHISLN
ncbi:MAG: DNA primase [Butyrivibrio sp.]|nr:DNA primase [Butyrivibrio sp.]